MKYDIKERIFVVKKILYKLEFSSLVQRVFRSKFPKKKAPSSTVIKNIISSFEKNGSVVPIQTKSEKMLKIS